MARSKIKKIIIAVAIIALSTTAVGVGSQTVVNAQTELRPDLQIKIGGWGQASDFADTVQTKCESGGSSIDCIKIQWIGQYIGAIYQYGISAAVILAIVSVMIGGFLWLVLPVTFVFRRFRNLRQFRLISKRRKIILKSL